MVILAQAGIRFPTPTAMNPRVRGPKPNKQTDPPKWQKLPTAATTQLIPLPKSNNPKPLYGGSAVTLGRGKCNRSKFSRTCLFCSNLPSCGAVFGPLVNTAYIFTRGVYKLVESFRGLHSPRGREGPPTAGPRNHERYRLGRSIPRN